MAILYIRVKASLKLEFEPDFPVLLTVSAFRKR